MPVFSEILRETSEIDQGDHESTPVTSVNRSAVGRLRSPQRRCPRTGWEPSPVQGDPTSSVDPLDSSRRQIADSEVISNSSKMNAQQPDVISQYDNSSVFPE